MSTVQRKKSVAPVFTDCGRLFAAMTASTVDSLAAVASSAVAPL